MNSIYSWFILQDILNGEKYISKACINKYNKYEKDLKMLKNTFIKHILLNDYKNMFRVVEEDNYVCV